MSARRRAALFGGMPRRVAAATLCLIAACVIAGCGGDGDPPADRARRADAEATGEPGGAAADRLIFWVGCERVAALTDDELDFWEESGVDGFVCMVGRLRDFGGTQDFTGDEDASLPAINSSSSERCATRRSSNGPRSAG